MRMSRRHLLLVLLLLHPLFGGGIRSATSNNNGKDDDIDYSPFPTNKKKTNILLFLTDDQDVALGSFDYMPKARKLLQEQGMTFDNYFVHTPICCPSRSTILTGRYLHNCNTKNNSLDGNCYGNEWKSRMETQHTYNLAAKQAGYTTVFNGKYLNQYGRCPGNRNKVCSDIPPGWDHWLGLVGNSVYYNYTLVQGGINQSTTVHEHGDNYEKDYLPDVMMNYTMDLLVHNKLPEPWLVVMSWPSCHAPFTPTPKFDGTMSNIDSPQTENYNASDHYMQQKHWLLRHLHPLSNKTSKQINKYYQMRLENLKTIDDHIETVMGILEHNNQLDETVVMYTSDNGFNFGQFRLFDKRHLYENDIRVPFVIRGPNIPPNTTSKQLAASIDIAPTIVDIVQSSNEEKKQSEKEEKNSKMFSIDGNNDNHNKIDVDNGDGHDGLSMWKYVQGIPDPYFLSRNDMLISYHGMGDKRCGLASCPFPWDGILWAPDSFNNTYHCVRTCRQNQQHQKEDDDDNDDTGNSNEEEEDSIYCRFQDDENFVEYYNLISNPQQLSNDYSGLDDVQRQRYEHRLKELMSCHGLTCHPNVKPQSGAAEASESS